MSKKLLQSILETFPQADPASEFYEEGIDGSEAVDFITEIVPKIRTFLSEQTARENRTLNALQSAWDFIENVSFEDPNRNDKFFELRAKVRDVTWDREFQTPILAVLLEGGLVQAVVSDQPQAFPQLEVMVIDYDSMDSGKDELEMVPQADGSIKDAYCRLDTLEPATVDLKCVLEQLNGIKTIS
jgi:hypothetical protein